MTTDLDLDGWLKDLSEETETAALLTTLLAILDAGRRSAGRPDPNAVANLRPLRDAYDAG